MILDPNRGHRRRRRRSEGGAGTAPTDRRGSGAARGARRSAADSRAARAISQRERTGRLRELGCESRRPGGRILVLLDANGDCPAELGATLLQRARAARPDLLIEVVLAKCEYESWFIAAADSLRGTRGISSAANVPPDPESIRGAKEWLRARMSGPYSPTADQAALTARFDMTAARRRAPSFDKMWRAVSVLMQ